MGAGHVSHCRPSACNDHLYHSFVVSERCAFEGTWSTFDRSTFWCNTCLILCVLWISTPVSRVHAWVGFGILGVVPSTSITKSHMSSAEKPSMRNPASNDMISDFVELWDTEVCFLHIQLNGTNVRLPKMHKTPPDVDFESSRSPAKSESWKILVYIVVLYFPRNNIACIHMCDECKRSNDIIVSHMLWSMFWSIVQVCSLTIEYQVHQSELEKDISETFVSKRQIILQQIHFLRLQKDGHPSMALRLCFIAQLFYWQVRNIFPRISSRDLPCHRTMKISFRHQVSPWLVLLAFFL